MALVLEPRFLFDASVAPAATKPITDHAIDSPASAPPAAQGEAHAAPDANAHPAESKAVQPESKSGPPAAEQQTSSQQPAAQAASTTAVQPSSVLFVDTRVSGWQTLAASVSSDTKVVVIDGTTDGISQVTKALEGLRNVDHLDFLTYGRPGQIELGAGTVDAGSLQANAGQVAAWRDHLSDNAEIQFWGCDLGAGTAGATFVSDLHALTGVAVAASIDATGSAALGGNWALERTAGDATPSVPFSIEAVGTFLTVLDAPLPTVTLTGLPSEILLGGTFSATVTFDNTATTGVGYGPYIDLFIPNNSLDKVTLDSASLLGRDLSISSVVYSTSVPGHLGVLGALHPLLLDASGNPQFVNAPPTAVEGGRMYVLLLPFGSFTPDQTAANVTLNFTIDKTSVLTDQHAGQLMTMGAIGGYVYGADALNNPSVDPGIRGTAGNTPTESTIANGGVSVSASVVLVDATAVVITEPGEGETATGPDFPAHYQITITPAPATDGNPITGSTATITLPNTVQYTGGPITITGATGGTATFVPAGTPQGGAVQVSLPTIEGPGNIVIDIPIFVPETAADGTAILDPDTGAPTTITFNTASFDNGEWMPWTGSADEGLQYDVQGNLSATASFTARSLAVQVSAFDTTSGSASNFRPGDTVEFTTAFEISDFFNFNSLVMQAILDDGFTLDPTVAPVLVLTPAGGGPSTTITLAAISSPTTATINGQVVAESGSNSDWSFVRNDGPLADGVTTVDLTPSSAIAAALGSSQLGEGVTGTLTLTARVLDKYTHSHVDPFTSAGGSITERDTVDASVSATATVVTALGLPTTLPPSQVSDNSDANLAIPQGTARIFVVAVNGVQVGSFAPGTTVDVQPGDSVTYAINYNLVTGDYQSLIESAFMPLPIVSVTDPLANGGSVSAFVEDTAATLADPFPDAGKYFLYNPSAGMTVQSANVDGVSNSVTFDLGHRDDPTNAVGQRATVLFTFVVTTAPFADGLSLTAQGDSSLTNASGDSAPIGDLSGITLAEPDLTNSARTGVASLVDNSLTPKTGGYTAELTGASLDPGTLYDPAGSAGSPFVDDGAGPQTVGDLQDLNVTGADGSDTVRVIITIANTGSSSGGSFDVTVSSALPTGYTIADVSNILATRGGGLPVTLVPNDNYGTGTMADLFTAGGVMLEDPASTASTPTPTLFGVNDVAHRNVLTISYDLKLKPDQSAGALLTAVGTIVNYTNIYNGVATGNGFVINGVPVGGNAADLVNNATVTTTAPTMPKTFGPSDTPLNDNVDPAFPNATVVVGNTRPVTITVNLPEGSLNNGAGHVLVTEQLPANEIFRNLVSITPGAGVTLTGAGGASVSGNTVTFDLGSLVTNTNADSPGTVTITYNAYFADGSNTDGTTFTSTANLVYSGSPIAPAVITFVEHDPAISATLSDDAGGIAYTGRTVTYTYTISNTGLVQSQATESQLNLPTGLTYVPGSLQLISQTGSPISVGTVDDSNGGSGVLVVQPGALAGGGVLTYRFQATVQADLAAGTDLTVAAPASDSSGLSIATPQAPATAREYNFSAADPLSIRVFTSQLFISGEANGTTVVSAAAPVTSANVVIGDITRLHGQAQLPEGQNTNVVLDFVVPPGYSPFLADGTVRLALISDNGNIRSSTLDPLGNTAGLQVAEGASAINPTTFTPTFILPGSAVDSTSVPGHLLIRLGTVTDNSVSPLPNYAVLEFNGVVTNVVANQSGTVLSPTMTVASDALTTAPSQVNQTIVEPNVDMQKVVTAIDSAGGTVTYRITLTNTGNATAYAVNVTDPRPTNSGSITGLSSSGGATDVVLTPGILNVFTATMTLAAGQTQVITYTMAVADPTLPVPPTTISETFQSMNPTVTTAFGSTVGAVGSATGSRDGSSLPTPGGLNDYWRQVTNSLSTASGQVWQALGDFPGVFDPLIHTPLSGVLMTHTSPGPDGVFGTSDDLQQFIPSAIDGTWFFGLIPNGTFRITVPASGASGLPASETLVFNAFGSIPTQPALASSTASGSAVTGMNFAYELPNTAPVLSNWSTTTQTILPNQVVNLSTTFNTQSADAELDVLVASNEGYSYQGTVLTIQRYDGSLSGAATPNANDVFGGDASLSLSGANVLLNGISVGTFTQAAGVLTITFGANTTKSTVAGVMNHVTYSNTNAGVVIPNLVIGARLNDANANNVALATGFTGRQGTGGPLASSPVYSVLALGSGVNFVVTFTEPNNTPAPASAINLPGGQLDLAGTTLTQVVVKLEGGFVASQDVLSFTNDGATMGDIVGSYNAATGELTLTSATGAPGQAWQNAAAAIQYYNTSDQPNTVPRDVRYTFTASAGPTPPSGILGHIAVVAVNDSPVLDPAANVTVVNATEDVLAAPSGAVGTLVNTLAAGNITDLDGANAHDGSAPGPAGMAIISADITQGSWWYSTDNGANWTRFAGTGLPAISAANALHLVADASTRIYFQPTTANFNGAFNVALGFRAWDRADGVANGTRSALPTDSALGTGTNTQASAYSSATDTIPQIVDPLNDAPVASGTSSYSLNEDGTPSAPTVATLFTANFSDTADQQQTASNPTGTTANVLAGVAIVGNATPAAAGTWQYSIDGSTWTNLGAVSDTSAVVLSASAQLRFVPIANFNGDPADLTVRLIDSSTVPVAGTTGAALLATTQAIVGANVSANGGTTAVSAGTVPLLLTVPAVNDAPIATGTSTLGTEPEDTASPTTATVLSLFNANFSDTADQQRSLTNLAGSQANTLAGIAITGNLTPAGEGTWRYSLDGGATWVAIPQNLSATNALVLSASVQLDFLPSADFNGAPLTLAARLIDSSNVAVAGTTTGADLLSGPQAITGVDVSGANSGGTTAVSLATVELSMTVSPVNDAPTAAGEATLRATVTGSPPQSDTVGNLFTPSFGDAVDLQRTAINPTGSLPNLLAGVVVVGNTAPASQGTWQYSVDGGASWTAIPTSVSDTAGLALGSNVRLAFFAEPGFIGFPTPLDVRLIDSSTDVPVSPGQTGQSFLGTTLAIGGVNVSGAGNGGITAISVDTVPLRTVILPTGPFSLPFQEPNNTPAAGSAVLLPGATPAVPPVEVFVDLGGGFVPGGEDMLFYTPNSGTGDIVGSYDASTGRLTLTSAGAATPTNWDNALNAISYVNTSDQPHNTGPAGARSITYTFVHADSSQTVLTAGELTVAAANDAPILNPTVQVTLVDSTEDVVAPPSGAVGTLVSALANASNISDLDGANAHDNSAPGPAGLAVVSVGAVTTANGNWWFTTDGGGTWTQFAGAGLPAISASNALHLVADANTRIYFQPTTPNINGATAVALDFRAWDRSDGVANGTLSALPTPPPPLSTGINTAASAYSIAVTRVGIVVDPVNDAPVASGTASYTVNEDGTPPARTVASLFITNFSDTADQQQTAGNPTGSVANALAGVAIVGNSTPASAGTWQYSTDGTTWTAVGSVSDTSALVLSASARLRFVPAANFNGDPADLTVRLIDSSSVVVTGTTTGAQLLATTQAITGVDVSTNGGTTAVSAGTVPLLLTVPAVNDAPIATGASSYVVNEDAGPSVPTVSNLFTANFSDTADQQQNGGNPAGSLANNLAGVAIVGNATPAAAGTWQYSTDGSTWTNLGAVSDTSAVVLSASAQLRFVPVANFNGDPADLTVRLIDSSNVVVTGTTTGAQLLATTQAITGVDVSVNGGTTAVSAGMVPLLLTVPAVNDAPIATGTSSYAVSEDGAPSVPTVSSLFTANFSDTADQQQSGGNPDGSMANSLAGIAIVGNATPAAAGTWQYSTDGSAWTNLGAVSDISAVVLSASAQLRFVPAADFNGDPADLTVRLIDSSNVVVTGTTTGAQLLATTQAITGVDVSTNGGTTAVSAGTVPLLLTVPAVNDAPVASGTSSYAVSEDGTPSVPTVATLFTANFSDTADQQQNAGNVDGSVANSLAGVAIVGNATPASAGTWQYSTDGSTWTNLGAVSDTSAVVLSASAQLRFVPTADFNGDPADLTVRLIDSSNVVVTGTTTGAQLLASTQVITGVDVSVNGGTTAVSAGTVPLDLAVTAVNDAPIATGVTTLGVEAEDGSPNRGTVFSLFNGNFSDTADQQQNGGNPGGSLANELAGVAVIGNSALLGSGDWRYSTNGGLTWETIPRTVTALNALVLSHNVLIEFAPAPDYNGVPGGLTVKLIDSSTTIVSGSTTGQDLLGLPQAIAGVNVFGANNGGTTAVSTGDVPMPIVVAPVNDAPVATGPASLGVKAEDTPIDPTVFDLFIGSFSDTADQQRTFFNPSGSDANTLAGVAIVGNASPASEGVWRYSVDGGATWSTIPTGLSVSNALVLSQSVRIEFIPAANFNGLPTPLLVRLIDTSSDVPLVSGVTGFDLAATTQAISGVDVSGSNSGGITAVSASDVPLLAFISPVNDAPTAEGSASLGTGTQGQAPPHDSVFNLFNPSFGDATDQQRSPTNLLGSVAHTLAGVVVVGNTTPAEVGTWRYSIDGGVTWTAVSTTVSDATGLLLGSNVRLSFMPAAGFSGSPPPLIVRLVDSSSDVPVFGNLTGAALAGSNVAIMGVAVDGTNNGGITAISVGTVPLNTSVNLAPPPPSPPGPPNPPFFPPDVPPSFGFDSYFDDLGMASDFLYGGNVFRVMLATRPGAINVSADVFYGSMQPNQLTFTATTISGGPLPPWLAFDPILLRFTGTPPLSAVGTLDLRITARDNHSGREAKADVHVVITEPPRDIARFLRPLFGINPIAVVPPAPVQAPSAEPAPAPPAATPESAPPVEGAPPPAPSAPDGVGIPVEAWDKADLYVPDEDARTFGLTAQMRDQSMAGRFARSRALLNALM